MHEISYVIFNIITYIIFLWVAWLASIYMACAKQSETCIRQINLSFVELIRNIHLISVLQWYVPQYVQSGDGAIRGHAS